MIIKLTVVSTGSPAVPKEEPEHFFVNTHYIERMRRHRESERTRIWFHDPVSGRVVSHDVKEEPEAIMKLHNNWPKR